MSGQNNNQYGQHDSDAMQAFLAGDNAYLGLNNFSAGKLVLPNLTPVNATYSTNAMRSVADIQDTDTILLGTKVYTFRTALTPTEGEVLINGSDANAIINLKAAVNHTGTPNTDYKCAAANTLVLAGVITATSLEFSARTKGAITIDSTFNKCTWDNPDVFTLGLDGTPGMKGMVFYDEANAETWKCNVDNYTTTQDSWYNTANSASNIAAMALKQDKALTAQSVPTTATVGYLGQTIIDTNNYIWQCVFINAGAYTWKQIYPEPIMLLSLSADQTTGNAGGALAAGDRIKFNTTLVNTISGASVDTITNIGSITLPIGKYMISHSVKATYSAAGLLTTKIYETGGAALGVFSGGKIALTFATNTGDHIPVTDYISLTVETDIEVQMTGTSSLSTLQSSSCNISIRKVG